MNRSVQKATLAVAAWAAISVACAATANAEDFPVDAGDVPGATDIPIYEQSTEPAPDATVMGNTCVEPTGASSSSSPAYIRKNYLNQWQCKIPLRQGLHSKRYGFDHIYRRGLEKVAAGQQNNHEVTSYAQTLWGYAIARVGGTMGANPNDPAFFAASFKYETPGGTKRTMCVFYDTKNYSENSVTYKVKGIITAYWISGDSSSPTSACINAKSTAG